MYLGQDYYEIFGTAPYPGAEFPFISYLPPRHEGEINSGGGGGGGGMYYPYAVNQPEVVPETSVSYPAPTYKVEVTAPYYVEPVKAGFPWWILLILLGLIAASKKK